MILPPEAASLLNAFAPLFTHPTLDRFVTLLAGVLLTPGRRTVANILRTLEFLAPGHPASYRRVLSAARGSGVELGCAVAGFLLKHVVPDGPAPLVGDDTVAGHPGRHVYGKARHRDPVRSAHSYTAWRYGHKWVVLAILVRFPLTTRPWAVPVLGDLSRSAEDDRRGFCELLRRRPVPANKSRPARASSLFEHRPEGGSSPAKAAGGISVKIRRIDQSRWNKFPLSATKNANSPMPENG